MKCVQVVTEFVRNTPLEPDMLDQLADACLDALHREAPFVALGPVASVDYERCAVEIECTIQSEAADDSDLEAKMQRVKDVMRDALMAA